MRVLTSSGVEVAAVRDEATASLVGSYWGDVKRFLATGDPSALDAYVDVVIDGFELETDLDAIEDFDVEGQLDFWDIYEK